MNRSYLVKKTIVSFVILLAGLAMWGCQSPATTPSIVVDTVPTVQIPGGLKVEGKLVPKEYVDLSFNMGGTVTELLVKEGDTLQAGQVIARLDQHPRLESAVAAAELEVVNARQALQALNDNAEVSTAAAVQSVAAARDAVREAERYLNNLKKGSRQTDINSAKADVVVLKDKLDTAQEDYARYERKPEDDVTRATYLSKLADAQRKYDNAERLLNNLEGTPSDIDMSIAEANLSLAQARLALAQSDYEDVKSGPDPDALETAQARLSAADSAQQAAQATLADAELVSPISGTLVELDLKDGEQVTPLHPVAVVADFSEWKVETNDLNEMDIPRVEVGQSATITPDALPDLKLDGSVESISQLYVEKFGDVTYTAHLTLNESDPRLRWGMTVSVEFAP
jgi:multidrug resistance efflux pump